MNSPSLSFSLPLSLLSLSLYLSYISPSISLISLPLSLLSLSVILFSTLSELLESGKRLDQFALVIDLVVSKYIFFLTLFHPFFPSISTSLSLSLHLFSSVSLSLPLSLSLCVSPSLTLYFTLSFCLFFHFYPSTDLIPHFHHNRNDA